MSEFLGIQKFGSLTTQDGKRISFKDMDTNTDGIVSKDEYNAALEAFKVSLADLETVDTDGDLNISEDEFSSWEQKIELQDVVNEYTSQINSDFPEKSDEIGKVLESLIDDFASSFTGDIADIKEEFRKVVEEKLEELKSESETQESETQESGSIVDDVIETLLDDMKDNIVGMGTSATLSVMRQGLAAEAEKFIADYTGDNLKADLMKYLAATLYTSDSERLSEEIESYNNDLALALKAGGESGLLIAQSAAETLLKAAINKGIDIELNGQELSNSADIEKAVAEFTDISELNNAIQNIINGLNTITAQASQPAPAAANSPLTNVQGSDFRVSVDSLGDIPGYSENKRITIKKQGKDGAIDDAVEYLKDNLLLAVKNQIRANLEAKGVDFADVEDVIDNIFTETAWESAKECVDGKRKILKRRTSSWFNVQELVDNFVFKFNNKIDATIYEMNKSQTDMDLQDVDIDELFKEDPSMQQIVESGSTIRVRKRNYIRTAENLINRTHDKMYEKAEQMCAANGIKFDKNVFEGIFERSKGKTVFSNFTGRGNAHRYVYRQFGLMEINPKEIISEFMENFKTNYSNWVNITKANTAPESDMPPETSAAPEDNVQPEDDVPPETASAPEGDVPPEDDVPPETSAVSEDDVPPEGDASPEKPDELEEPEV